ncbi:MAG: glycosyltransferase family 4 protein [Actinomycetota bacterium]
MARVLLVGKGPPDPGGLSRVLQDIRASALLQRHEVELLNLTRADEPDGGRLTAGNLRHTLSDAYKVFRASSTAEVVHIHSALAPHVTLLRAGLLSLAARVRGARVVVHAHGGRLIGALATPLRRLLARVALFPAHRIIAVSTEVRDTLAAALGEKRIVVIDNGIDTAMFSPKRTVHDPPRILYAGVLSPRKGVLDLLTASELLSERGVEHELWLAGGTPGEGAQAEAVVRAATAKAARWLGVQPPDAMPGLYRNADVFCLPSWWEAMPLSVLEAMASSLPVVAARVGDIPRAVSDGVTGRLVAPKDPTLLADALEPLLSDPDLRRSMGRAGRQRVEQNFDINVTCASLDRLYENLGA